MKNNTRMISKIAMASVLLTALLFILFHLFFEQRRGVDTVWLGISNGIEAYGGTQPSFSAHFFPGELGAGFPISAAIALPDVDDPMAWQANFKFNDGSLGDGWLCTQFGVQTLEEIDSQAGNGTPTNWRDTLLRESINEGYIAKLNCEFRFLNIRYRDADRDAVLASLHEVFDEVSITSEVKGSDDLQYTQHRIRASNEMSTKISRLELIINDQGGEDDNVRGRIIILVQAPQS